MRNLRTYRAAALAACIFAAAPTAHADVDAQASSASFARALTRFQAGDIRGSRVELLNALKQNPDNGVARLLFARTQIARGNGVAAQTEIERAVKAGIPREKTYHLTANALLLQNKASQALDMARNPHIPPQFASYAARMRGRAELALGNTAVGGRELGEAVRLAPNSSPALADLARFQAGSNDLPGATRSIDRAVQLDPGNVEGLLLKGGIVRATQGPALSLAWYDRALKVDPNSVEALLERAETLSGLGRFDPATADIKHVLGLVPGQPIAMYMSAMIAVRQGKYPEAEQFLAQTRGVLDKYPPAMLLRAQIALKQKNMGVAYNSLTGVVNATPGNLQAREALAQVQLQRGDPRGALTTLEPLAKLPNPDAGTLALLGSAHAQTGDFVGAQAFFERAAKLAPNLPALNTQLAMTRMAQGDAKGAVAGLDAVLKTDPKSLQALISLTYVNLRAGDYKGALATAGRLVTGYPNLPVSYNLRGTAYLGVNDVVHAEADFRAAIAKDPKFLDARRNLAQLMMLTKRAGEGNKELRAIVADNPGDTRSLMLLANVAGQAKAWPERIDWLRRAVASSPKDPAPRAALIQTYVIAGRSGDALTEATGLARDRPSDPEALQLLAAAQSVNKQPAAALATFRRIVDLAPKSPEARILLARAQASAGPSGVADARATLNDAIKLGGPGAVQAYIGLVQLELGAKNPDAALAAAERLKASTTQKLAAEKLIGDVNMAAGRYPAALAAYEQLRVKANNGTVAQLIARAQFAMGQKDQGLKTLQDYHAANPKDLLGGVSLADAYVIMKNWHAAIDTYLSMRNTTVAGIPAVLNNLAFAYGEVGDSRAIAAAARANQLAPDQPTVEDTYGWVLLKNGRDSRRALALLQAASKGLPNDPNIRYHLGVAYKANNMRPDAARELKLALAAPGFEDAPAARQALAAVGG